MRGNPFLAAHADTLKRMAAAGYTDGEIARHLGFSLRTVFERRSAMGLTSGARLGRYVRPISLPSTRYRPLRGAGQSAAALR